MNHREQPAVPPVNYPEDPPLLWTPTPTGGLRTGWIDPVPPDLRPHSGPATAEDFLGTLGLGQDSASDRGEQFGPIGSDPAQDAAPTYAGKRYVAEVYPDQPLATDAETGVISEGTVRAVDDRYNDPRSAGERAVSRQREEAPQPATEEPSKDVAERVESIGTLGIDGPNRPQAPVDSTTEEELDFSEDPLDRTAQKRRRRGFEGVEPSDRAMEARDPNIPSSVARRQPDYRQPWQRPRAEE